MQHQHATTLVTPHLHFRIQVMYVTDILPAANVQFQNQVIYVLRMRLKSF